MSMGGSGEIREKDFEKKNRGWHVGGGEGPNLSTLTTKSSSGEAILSGGGDTQKGGETCKG